MGSLVLILMTLLVLAQTTEVQVINQCDCDKLSSQPDCSAKPGCSWSSKTSTCFDKAAIPTTDGYCELISDSAQCSNTKGCAYIGSACTIFAGCTAYKGTTDAECQSISRYCNSDEIAYCKNPGSCSSFKTQENCTGKASITGSGLCVWDISLCRDQKCTEASQSFNNDVQCNNFIKGCVTNGKGCIPTLGACSTYSGDIETCEGLIGKDGNCKGVDGGTKCQARICTEADTSLTTDQACEVYQKGCVTTGYGCIQAPLGVCSTLTGDDVICANKKGQDGKCKGVVNGKNCSPIICSDAVETLITDKDCDAFKKGCVTTGKGCTTTKGLCQTYKGTSETCVGYIGSDGYCKGSSDNEAACSPKVCKDADSTLNTDELCNQYQIGCKTTGKGCVATLSNCSSYTGDSTTCEGYIGLDGKCKGSTQGPCSPKVCTEASTSFKTNEECAEYQSGCIALENGGCILAGECSTLLSQYQCSGKKSCQWNPQCVKNTVCSDLSSEILCKTVKLQNDKTCWWVSQSCVNRECTQASTSYDSDSLCDSFLTGCLTKKKGCITSTESCTSYQGSKTTCESFTIKCTNTEEADESTYCLDKPCSSNTTATTDSECDSYHKGCLTKGTGCIDSTAPCTSYDGNSVEICGKFIGNGYKCWWSTPNQKCEDRACNHANSTYTTDSQCEQFLSGCVTTGSGCKKYFKQGVQCLAEKTCGQIIGATNQQSCEDILPGVCMFVKDKCIKISTGCSDYKHDNFDLSLADCQNLKTLQGQLCYWQTGKACVNRSCDQITDVGVTLATCQAHLYDCAAKSNGIGCENAYCPNSQNKTNEAGCQSYHPICRFYSLDPLKCINASFCYNFQPGNCSALTTTQNYKCAEPNSGSFCVNASCLGQANCESVQVYQKGQCVLNNSVCEERNCAKYFTHLQQNPTLVSQCLNYLQECVLTYEGGSAKCTTGLINSSLGNYGCPVVKGTADQCLTLQGLYSAGLNKFSTKLCAAHDQGNTISACFERTCNDIQKTTDIECQEYLSTCKTDGTKCIDLSTPCSSLLSQSEGCGIFTGLTEGSKCQDSASLQCNFNMTATTDAECDIFLKGCITTGNGCTIGTTLCSGQTGTKDECKLLTGNGQKCWSTSITTNPCVDRICSHDTTSTTDQDCDQFLKGCVTKGFGCIEKTAECSSYQGSQADCEKFIGNGKSCTNETTATATTYCKIKDCTKVSSDSYTENICQAFSKHCHYYGNKCDSIQTCASVKGNFRTCSAYVASDGPCKGTSLQTEAPTNCQPASCSDAPISLTTDFDCDLFKKGCLTNGRGCGQQVTCGDVSAESSCLAFKSIDKNICAWASQCREIQLSCSSYTAHGQSVCFNTKISQGFGFCIWKNSNCTEQACEDLPLSVTSEDDCNVYSNNCTFAGVGQGCVTKGFCKSYTTKEICVNAKSQDQIGYCSWDETFSTGNQIVGCRAKNCSDASTMITTTEDCEAFIPGCKSNGAGCMAPPFECKDFKTQEKCLQDSSLRPCLWYNYSCIQFNKCEDLTLKTIQECQGVSKYCTSDSIKCIPKQPCASYTKQFQCQIGTDGQCGWVTATKKCQLFTQCTDLISKVNSECNTYNFKCISNGTNCIDKAECSTYGDSEQACQLGGTDGSCYYDKDLVACRLKQCSDATTSITTHNGCYGFYINSQTKCTTDGQSCILLADCSIYTQVGCVIDVNLKPCIFDKLSNLCKQKTCIDIKKTKTSECQSALSGCVSNGTTCISKAKCADYTSKESCNAGGTDGSCVFTSSSAQSVTGTCKLFTQCSDANFDQSACLSKSAACKWTPADGTRSSSCTVHTCDSAAKGTNKCVPIPNFDASSYIICVLLGNKCVQGDPNTLAKESCYKMSSYTYTWNSKTEKCQACVIQNTTQDNNSVNNTNNNSESQTEESAIIRFISVVALLILMI